MARKARRRELVGRIARIPVIGLVDRQAVAGDKRDVGENRACQALELEEGSDGEATCCRNHRCARPLMQADRTDRVHHHRAIQRRSPGDLEQVRPSKGGVDVDVHAAAGQMHKVARQLDRQVTANFINQFALRYAPAHAPRQAFGGRR